MGLAAAVMASGALAQDRSPLWHHACACWTYADLSLAIAARARTVGAPEVASAARLREIARAKGTLGLIALENAGPFAMTDPGAVERAGMRARRSTDLDPHALWTASDLREGFRRAEALLETCQRRLDAWSSKNSPGSPTDVSMFE